MFVSELPDDFASEAARLLHNYLAALTTLRDVQRGIHRRIWPELHAPGTDDKRTKWEVEVWARAPALLTCGAVTCADCVG